MKPDNERLKSIRGMTTEANAAIKDAEEQARPYIDHLNMCRKVLETIQTSCPHTRATQTGEHGHKSEYLCPDCGDISWA